ncbi:MAG TPA: hypothetical protein PKD90_07295 [Phnomibacter sp.]|nr:hypothetical protein [Phnomibacter sp.]
MNTLKKGLMATFICLGATTAMAQVQLGAFGSYSKGTGENNTDLWGGGAHLRFFMGKVVALGGSFKTYPKVSEKFTVGSTEYTRSNLLSNLTGTFDLLLAKNDRAIQPFIGADAGFSFASETITGGSGGSGSANFENKKTYFMISPKAGLNIGLGKTFGLFGQAQYNYTFGDGNPNTITIPGLTLKSTPVDRYLSFDAGIYVRLVGAGRARDRD